MTPITRRDFLQALRLALPWYIAILGIPSAVWLSMRLYLQSSSQIRATVNSSISTIIGAVVGAATIYVGQAVFERRRKRGELVARLPGLAYDTTAALAEYLFARSRTPQKRETYLVSPELAKMLRLDGALAQFEIEWRVAFSGRRSRVAVRKFRERIVLAKEYFLSDEVDVGGADEAIDWILEQADKAGRFGAAEAGVSFTDPGGLKFVRFGRVTEQDKRDLSFVDSPPPWTEVGRVPHP